MMQFLSLTTDANTAHSVIATQMMLTMNETRL